MRQQHPRPRPRLSGPGQVSQRQQHTYQLTIISIIIQHTVIMISQHQQSPYHHTKISFIQNTIGIIVDRI